MAKNLTKFRTTSHLTMETHCGNSIRVSDGTVLAMSKQGKLVIPAHTIKMGKKGTKEIPAVTTRHLPIEFSKWLAPIFQEKAPEAPKA
jgi:hypothetical protein